VVEAVHAAKAFAGHLMAIEIEVDTLDQFAALILALPDRGAARRGDARQHGPGNRLAQGRGDEPRRRAAGR
jgi:hypothetical protein